MLVASGMYLFDGFFWIMQWLVAVAGLPKLSLVGDVGVVGGSVGGGGGGCEFARLRRKRCDFVGRSWFRKERKTEKKGERHRKNKNNNKEIIFKWGDKK